jgi:hypothetical protein
MIPANKIKEISNNIHFNIGGDSDGMPPFKPLLIVLIGLAILFLLVLCGY